MVVRRRCWRIVFLLALLYCLSSLTLRSFQHFASSMHVHLRGLYDRSSVRSPIQESEGSRGRNPEQALLSVSQTDNTIVQAAAHGSPRLIFQTVLSMLAMASVYIIFMLLGMQVFRNYHDPSSVRSQSHQQVTSTMTVLQPKAAESGPVTSLSLHSPMFVILRKIRGELVTPP